MRTRLSRNEAVSMLSRLHLRKVTLREREDLLLDWWPVDRGDPILDSLSTSLRSEILKRESPEHPADDPRYDDLLLCAVKAKSRGVKNSYLEMALLHEGAGDFEVVGEVEALEACPCCGYRALPERGTYEICPVCFWEDDGGDDPERYSSPNKMSLKEAQANFYRLGAVSVDALSHVLKDGRERYCKA